ncbi:Uncharacterized protein ESCO_003159 [Escovopsis weberi]|uniref:Uncharacterized protein n=1 Tax=Escovopsis weberi TaxID=150374 RepID=A0A0M8N1K4_ESCWE|nr:Uncharacterized protein ESCO_003159 [Escovopsis weberi]
MMAQQVPHQATDKKRVKVYELRNNDWFDRGTGFCSATFATTEDGRKDPKVIVESEEHPERLLLETKIQKEDGFQKQQETLIVWQEPVSGVDMALSFQEAEGCAMIWKYISTIQQSFQNAMSGGVDDGLSDDLAAELPPAISLPAAELGNLAEIDTSMRIMGATADGREALAKLIMHEGYIGKLTDLVTVAEDLESLEDLHHLCNIMKSIILLNDASIIEHAVSDKYLMGVVGALEYDPDFPSHKANHRLWLGDKRRYKEVVPINDELIQRKIHQTHRLQYLKDVILARILDDPTFSVLNSLIFFNQVDVVQHLHSDPSFLTDLFGVFNSSYPDQEKKKDAVLFLQQCCTIAKNIQPPARQALYTNFLEHGLLRVIHFGLRHGDVAVRVGATDILISVIDYDPMMIRQTIQRQMHEGQTSLIDSLIELLLVEVDLGVKSQISEALKVILDQAPPIPGPEGYPRVGHEMTGGAKLLPAVDPEQELFLSRFYDSPALRLFRPLIELERRSDMKFSAHQASMYTYVVDLLGFFIRQHHRFSRYFFMNHNLAQRVAQLLKSTDKYLKLVAIRFFRVVIGLQEEFYIKNLIEKGVLSPILQVMIETMPRDNLVSSACLELIEYIRKENLKDLVKHLVANHREALLALNYMPTIRDLILRYDQTQGCIANMEYFMDTDENINRRPPPNTRMMEHISMDPREEEYWDGSDPEDEHDDQSGASADRPTTSNGSSNGSKPLVDYASDEEGDEGAEMEEDAKPKSEESQGQDNKNANDEEAVEEEEEEGVNTAASSSPSLMPVPPPERLSEKRRREEEDEDELGKLINNKRRNSNAPDPNAAPASPGLGTRRKSFTAGTGNGTPKKIAISLSSALRAAGPRSDDES